MPRIELSVLQELPAEAAELRRRAFGGALDSFDPLSLHVVAWVDGCLAATVRCTGGGHGLLEAWSPGLSVGRVAGDVDLTRGVVAHEFRGLGIYRMLMLWTMREVASRGFLRALAAIEPSFHQRPFLEAIGFSFLGEPRTFDDAPRQTTACVIECRLRGGIESWTQLWRRCTARARLRQLVVAQEDVFCVSAAQQADAAGWPKAAGG